MNPSRACDLFGFPALLALILSLLLSVALCRISHAQDGQEAPELHLVGDAAYAPYSFNYGGEYRGIDVEVIEELARRLELNLRLELVSRTRMLEMLRNGECDGVLALRPTEENRKLALLLRRAPLHVGTYSAFLKSSERFPIESMADLRGKTVAVLEAMDLGAEFGDMVKAGEIDSVEFPDESRAIGALLRGQVHVFIGQTQAVHHLLSKMGMSNTVQAEGRPLVRRGGEFLGLARSSAYPDKDVLLKLMELALSDMLADGTYRKIVHRYML